MSERSKTKEIKMANEVATLNGLYKDRYASEVTKLVPDHVKLYNAVKYDSSKKVGDAYVEPVILSLESGFTYGGEDGSLFDLEDAKEFKMKKASVKARELVLRSAISIAALNRSASGEQSIEKAMDLMVGNMLKSIYHRLEVQMFYGQSGLGIVSDQNADGDEVDVFPAAAVASLEILIRDSEWAAGVWNGTTGAKIDIFSADKTSKRGTYEILGYSLKNKSITVKHETNATIAIGELSESDVVFFKGACIAGAPATLNEFIGVHAISEETVSLFGVANANEPLFQGSIVDVGTLATPVVLSQGRIEEGIASMVEKGLMEEEVSVYVNPKQWDDLLNEQDSKRVIDSSYSSAKHQSGAREIEFFGQNGTIKIKASTFVKQGYAYIICEKDLKRIGSTEVTFKRPDGEEFFKLLEGKHGVEMRCMTDQALFTSRPASICQLRYIKSENTLLP
jgi:hypothetical protein